MIEAISRYHRLRRMTGILLLGLVLLVMFLLWLWSDMSRIIKKTSVQKRERIIQVRMPGNTHKNVPILTGNKKSPVQKNSIRRRPRVYIRKVKVHLQKTLPSPRRRVQKIRSKPAKKVSAPVKNKANRPRLRLMLKRPPKIRLLNWQSGSKRQKPTKAPTTRPRPTK